MSESYEDLVGASGRAQFFRPKRYPAAALFAGAPPRVWFDDQELSLEDISVNGIGAKARNFSPKTCAHKDKNLGVLLFTQQGKELLRIKAQIARVTPNNNGFTVGLAVSSKPLDLDKLQKQNAYAAAVVQSAEQQSLDVPGDYKSFCADVVYFVNKQLNQADLLYGSIENELSDDEKNQIVEDVIAASKPHWDQLLDQGNCLAIKYHRDKRLRKQLKAYTESVVTPCFLPASYWHRCYYKPAGYPGDYLIMNHFYDSQLVGESLKEKILHGLGHIASGSIKTRMQKLTELIIDHRQSQDSPKVEEMRIMSVGSGPARELEGLAKRSVSDEVWHVTLIDQEINALEFAYNSVLSNAGRDLISISALNISFKKMLSPSSLGQYLHGQDVVYSSGLVDYLSPLLATRFVKRMYDYVKPGGKLIIGNLNDLKTGMLWQCEYLLDWSLYFRNFDEMLSMAAEIPDARISIQKDALGAIYFLVAEKPL